MIIKATTTQHGLPIETADVIVVGAGPVGLLTALSLGRAGVKTIVLEAHHELLSTTRAVVYMPVVLPVLKELGILELVTQNAFLNTEGVKWRSLDGKVLAHLPIGDPDAGEFDGVLLIGQWRMNELILEELKKYPSVVVRFGLRCVGLDDNPDSPRIRVMAHTHSLIDDDTFFESKYLVATDGANSTVRRMACIPFDGFTYQDFKMIGTDVLYDFAGEEGLSPLNFVVDGKDWAVIAYTGQDEGGLPPGSGLPQWRVAYIEDPDLEASKEGYLERADQRIKRYTTKGHGQVQIIRAEPYLMQQRVATQAKKGRLVLAGDALHSNNPIGGLGLTGGILDAFCYGNALRRVLVENEPEQILADCASSRQATWRKVTDKLSQANMERLYSLNPLVVASRESFFAKLNDPENGANFAKLVSGAFTNMMPDTFRESSVEM